MPVFGREREDELVKDLDEHGHPRYALVPQLLPSIGFTHDPDGFNYEGSQGHMFLRWVDDRGITQTRYYDGAGVAVLAAVNTRAANDCHYARAA